MNTKEDFKLFADFVQTLKENGFKVYTACTDEDVSWAHFVKNNKVGYMQLSYWGGLTFSTCHKPCRNFGTGFGLYDHNELGNINPTIEDAEKAFIFAPSWANGNLSDIKKYTSWDDYLNTPTNQILKYKEL